jgi:dipeptidyl-peptidase-4
VLAIDDAGVLFTASEEPTEIHVWSWSPDEGVVRQTHEPGVHTAARGGNTLVVASAGLEHFGVRHEIRRSGNPAALITSAAATPSLIPRVSLQPAGERALRTALLLPTGYDAADGPLPVLLHPYGGPHGQMVVSARGAYLADQWIADQGFAVVIIDGRGTPGRGAEWERAIFDDLSSTVLEDQVDGLLALGSNDRS